MSSWDYFERLRREIRRIMREIEEDYEDERSMWDTSGRVEPLVSIDETPDRYIVLIDLPYADLKALSIDIRGRRVYVECRLAGTVKFDRWTVHRETVFDRYYTEFELPEDAIVDKAVIERVESKKIVKIIVPRRRV